MDVLFTAICAVIVGAIAGWTTSKRAAHWCQDCGGTLPLRHRAGEGCRADRRADIASYADHLATEPGARP
ncbi:hypothetical protein AB0B66_34425 [Catellatospora sp. NPDC049111]|uniref:hypothetical protein n=1 Tax=Catellatospora sp. NPDC049111 TaxID=3155271 RepID=UPI0033EF750D